MNYDSERYFNLTRPVASGETSRSRHVLVFVCTIIIASAFLCVDLTQIRFAGIDLSKASNFKVNVVALVMLGFWNFILFLNHQRDQQETLERKVLIDEEIGRITSEIEKQDEAINKGLLVTHGNREAQLKYIETHQAQLSRMSKLTLFESILGKLNLWLPHLLSVLSGLILIYHGAKSL